SRFSGDKPTLVPRHNIPCQGETWESLPTPERAPGDWPAAGFPAEELVPGLLHPVSGNDIEFQFFYQRAPEILVTSRFSGERPTLVPRHNIPCQAMTLSFSFCYQHRLVTSRFSGDKPTLVPDHNTDSQAKMLGLCLRWKFTYRPLISI
ncbi:hypothetical protein, partial [Vibrio sp. 10N.261.52.A1]